jgi:hypothetical protein
MQTQARMAYNPYVHYSPNPLTRGQKIALGVIGGVAAIGTVAAIILIPGTAKAKPRPTEPTKPEKKPTRKPPGSPPPYGDSCFPPAMGGTQAYDNAFWDKGGNVMEAREGIFAAFEGLGYETPRDRSTMNDPGPDAALGGGDDVPNSEVRRFQKDYNKVSTAKKFVAQDMGGLWEDGLVGPCTLNGLKFVMDNLQGRTWSDVVAGKLA